MAVTRNKGKRLNRYVKDYIVIDLETTGLSLGLDEIIELSAVKVVDSKVVKEYQSLVKPSISIPPQASAINGITNEMVREAPDIGTALNAFLSFIGNEILVGHNIHTFDTNFIYDAVMENFQKEFCNDYVDTLYLSRKCLPELKHHKLTDISTHFQIDTAGAHRALSDCIMNQQCYEELGRILAMQGDSFRELTCPKCGEELIRRKGRFGDFYGCDGYPGCRYTRNV